jgi:hypothetical protein
MAHIIAQAPSNASGTVTLGMTVAHRLRRKMKITVTTSTMVSNSVNCTSLTAARMVWVRSLSVKTLMEAGMAAPARGNTAPRSPPARELANPQG